MEGNSGMRKKNFGIISEFLQYITSRVKNFDNENVRLL